MLLVATASDVDTVIVDGKVVVCEGRHVLGSEHPKPNSLQHTGSSIGRSSSA